MKNILESYNKNGYYIAKSVFTNEFCKELISYLNTLEAKVTLPFTNVPWGYGNLLDQGPFKNISESKFVSDFCKNKFENYTFNHLYVHNKAPWVGASIEWHQEIFNVGTYASGYSRDEWDDFAQIYIALESQNLDNGCIRMFPNSHKEGFLPFEDAVNEHMSHKRRVPFEVLEDLSNKYGSINCKLEPGDVLLFNHLVVHGSSSNCSSKSRKAVVLQVRKNIREKNKEVFQKETHFRTNFVINALEERISELKSKKIYNNSWFKSIADKENKNEV